MLVPWIAQRNRRGRVYQECSVVCCPSKKIAYLFQRHHYGTILPYHLSLACISVDRCQSRQRFLPSATYIVYCQLARRGKEQDKLYMAISKKIDSVSLCGVAVQNSKEGVPYIDHYFGSIPIEIDDGAA